MPPFARTPPPPYVAVIFTSKRPAAAGDDGYTEMAERMVELAQQQPGFLGVESSRDAEGVGITVSYWRSMDDIRAWKQHPEHRVARGEGRRRWYEGFALRVAVVERDELAFDHPPEAQA